MLLWIPQGAAVTGLDLGQVVQEAFPALNATGSTDLVFWTETQLYGYLDETAKELARKCGVFVARDATKVLLIGVAEYALPARHLATVHVAANGKALTAADVQELEALDDNWVRTTATAAQRFVAGDALTNLRIYPAMSPAAGNLAVIFHQYLADVAKGITAIATPVPLKEYFLFSLLGKARLAETQGQMPEVGKWFLDLAGMLLDAMTGYWGEAR